MSATSRAGYPLLRHCPARLRRNDVLSEDVRGPEVCLAAKPPTQQGYLREDKRSCSEFCS
eukprot:700738-Amphidinium_carterae.1